MLRRHMTSLLRLSRWKEHILSTLPATLAGANMAASRSLWPDSLDGHLAAVTAANVLAVTFAFMVNDIEDAPDDAQNAARGARNAVTCGDISPRTGWLVSGVVGGLALLLFASVNRETFGIGTSALLLAFFYSWRRVRFKALPVVDVMSHLLMLSSLLFLAGYFVYDPAPGPVWWVAVGLGLLSAYGQFYNQLRDYDLDRMAGLHNTASILGRKWTARLMYGCLGAAGVCLVFTIVIGLWPLWLGAVSLVLSPLLMIARSGCDVRGTQAIDASGRLQWGGMIIATVVLSLWSLKIMI